MPKYVNPVPMIEMGKEFELRLRAGFEELMPVEDAKLAIAEYILSLSKEELAEKLACLSIKAVYPKDLTAEEKKKYGLEEDKAENGCPVPAPECASPYSYTATAGVHNPKLAAAMCDVLHGTDSHECLERFKASYTGFTVTFHAKSADLPMDCDVEGAFQELSSLFQNITFRLEKHEAGTGRLVRIVWFENGETMNEDNHPEN